MAEEVTLDSSVLVSALVKEDIFRPTARRTGKTVQCAVCSKEIYRPRWWFKINTTPICSQECMRKWQRIRVENNIIPRSRKTGQFLPSKRTIS